MPRKAAVENNDGPNGYELDPLIEALIQRLPAPGDVWPAKQRQLWLQILTLSFTMIYEDEAQPTATDAPHR